MELKKHPKKTIISVSSNRMGAGKSIFCDKLTEKAGRRGVCAKRAHFAEPLKRTVAELIRCASGGNADDIYSKLSSDREYKERPLEPVSVFGGHSPRELMQLMGTEFGRNLINPDIWIEICRTRVIKSLKDGADIVAIDDVRFVNEYEMLKDCAKTNGIEFTDVFIDRTSAAEYGVKGHVSEGRMDFLKDGCEYPIVNDGSLPEFEAKAEKITDRILDRTLGGRRQMI